MNTPGGGDGADAAGTAGCPFEMDAPDVPLFGRGEWLVVRLALLVSLIASAAPFVVWVAVSPSPEFKGWLLIGGWTSQAAAYGIASALVYAGPWEHVEVDVRPRPPARVRACRALLLVWSVGLALLGAGSLLAAGDGAWPPDAYLFGNGAAMAVTGFSVLDAYWNARLGKQRRAPRPAPVVVSRIGAWAGARLNALGAGLDRLYYRLRRTR